MKSLRWFTTFFALAGLGLLIPNARAQTPGVLYSWNSAGVQDWFKNFGAGTATLANPGGALEITETSATPGTGAAWSDGFNTIRDNAPFTSNCCGGLDLTGLTSMQFDLGHNGPNPVNIQFFTQASPGSNYVALGPDLAIAPGPAATYTVPITVPSPLSSDQVAYMRTIGINIRDHVGDGNLVWTLGEIRSVGTPLTTRTIADHNGGPADFDGVICNFDCGAVVGGNGGQNTSGMSVVGGALQWTDLGGGAGAAVSWGNGTQNAGGSFNARPVDLSNYDTATIRMSATGSGDPSVFVQFYMQTGSGFNFQAVNYGNLPVDGQFYDVQIPLASITNRGFVDTNGINLGTHTGDIVINIDSVIYSSVPEPTTVTLLCVAAAGCLGVVRRTRTTS
jgi:hypothetical protein